MSISSIFTIPKLDAIFARQGIPDVLKSDNEPLFNSAEFKDFAEHLGFQHHKITLLWPIENGKAKRFMTKLEECVRTTTISTIDISACEKQPLEAQDHYTGSGIISTSSLTNHPRDTVERDAEQKMKIKAYADQPLGVGERARSSCEIQATDTRRTTSLPVQSSTSCS